MKSVSFICQSICTPVCLCVACASVHPSLNVLKIESLVFFSYFTFWYLIMISNDWQSQIFQKKKKNGGSNLGLMGLNQAQKVFRHLLEFGSYAFLEIAQNDSFRQCLSSSRGEIYEKKRSKSIPKLGFLPFSQVKLISFFKKLHRMIAWSNVYLLIS